MDGFLSRLKEFLNDPRRLAPIAAVILVLGVIAAVPSKSSSKLATTGKDDGGQLAPGETIPPEVAASASAAAEAARKAAAKSGKSSTGLGNPLGSTSQGVSATEITIVFAYMHEDCGQDPSAFVNQVAPDQDPETSIKVAVEYFNKYPLEAFGSELPGSLKSQMATGYYGRLIKPVVVNDHGQFCADQSREDAKQAADKYKPFANIGGSDLHWDPIMPGKGVVRVTGIPALDNYYTSRRPYLWGPITGASINNDFLASYIGKYLKGKNSKDTGDGGLITANKPRVYGVYYQDDETTNAIVGDLRAEMAKRGVTLKTPIGYAPDLGTIGQQSRTAIQKFIDEGVTSIITMMDPIALSFISGAADANVPTYRPEWITNTVGLEDSNVVPRTFMSRNQQVNVFGTSVFFPSKQYKIDEVDGYKVWKKMRPNEEPPDDFGGWYGSLKLIAGGIAFAGPQLNPANFEKGMNSYCAPCNRTDPYLPLIGFSKNDYVAVDDGHHQHFDPDALDYTAPPCKKSTTMNCSVGGQPLRGAYVYEDGGRRYRSFD